MAEFFNCEADWDDAYNYAKEQGDTEKQSFETDYGTNYAEYQSKL